MKNIKKLLIALLVVSNGMLGIPHIAQAGWVTTADVLTNEADASTSTSASQRGTVRTFLQREEVRGELASLGLTTQAAQERVDAMTDDEVASLAHRIDQAPAGGDVLGLLFTVFIVLLVTDILGLTKVFPFTRSVR